MQQQPCSRSMQQLHHQRTAAGQQHQQQQLTAASLPHLVLKARPSNHQNASTLQAALPGPLLQALAATRSAMLNSDRPAPAAAGLPTCTRSSLNSSSSASLLRTAAPAALLLHRAVLQAQECCTQQRPQGCSQHSTVCGRHLHSSTAGSMWHQAHSTAHDRSRATSSHCWLHLLQQQQRGHQQR